MSQTRPILNMGLWLTLLDIIFGHCYTMIHTINQWYLWSTSIYCMMEICWVLGWAKQVVNYIAGISPSKTRELNNLKIFLGNAHAFCAFYKIIFKPMVVWKPRNKSCKLKSQCPVIHLPTIPLIYITQTANHQPWTMKTRSLCQPLAAIAAETAAAQMHSICWRAWRRRQPAARLRQVAYCSWGRCRQRLVVSHRCPDWQRRRKPAAPLGLMETTMPMWGRCDAHACWLEDPCWGGHGAWLHLTHVPATLSPGSAITSTKIGLSQPIQLRFSWFLVWIPWFSLFRVTRRRLGSLKAP